MTLHRQPAARTVSAYALFTIIAGAIFVMCPSRDGQARSMRELHLACSEGRTNAVAYWLAHGADVNRRDEIGNTALHAAAASGNVDVVRMLIDAGADLEIENDCAGTPLQTAAFYLQHDVVRVLIAAGARPDAVNHLGRCAMDYAVFNDDREMQDILENNYQYVSFGKSCRL